MAGTTQVRTGRKESCGTPHGVPIFLMTDDVFIHSFGLLIRLSIPSDLSDNVESWSFPL